MHAGTGVNKQVLMTRLLEIAKVRSCQKTQKPRGIPFYHHNSRLMLRQLAIHVYNFNLVYDY